MSLDVADGRVLWDTDIYPGHMGEIAGAPGWLFLQSRDFITTMELTERRPRGLRYARVATSVRAAGDGMYMTEYDTDYNVVWGLDRRAFEVWRWRFPEGVAGAVRVATPDVVVAEGGGYLWGLDRKTGKLLWRAEARFRSRQPEHMRSARSDATNRYAFTWSARFAAGEALYATTSSAGAEFVDTLNVLDIRSGKKRWSKKFKYSLETMIAHRGRIYLLGRTLDGFNSAIIELQSAR
jgi:outer membrane protein assembly factor BamB